MDYIVHNGELYHYGVKGMKWGVRKSEYKSMTRAQRKAVRKKYYDTPEGKVELATRLGTILAGPLGGIIAGSIANKKYNSDKGKKFVDDNANMKMSELSAKTESKSVASLKSGITGKKENGKPSFLMSQEELDNFCEKYEQRMATLTKRYKSATNDESRQQLRKQIDRLDNDFRDFIEQDFWYSDD